MKYLITTIVLVLSFSVISAPTQAAVGIHAGINNANVNATGIDTKSKTGYLLGIQREMGFLFLYLQPELRYIQKGYQHEADVGSLKLISEVQFHYIEIPIMLKIVLPMGLIKPYIVAGPSVGFNVNTTSSVKLSGVEQKAVTPPVTTKTFDLSVEGGMGLEFGVAVMRPFVGFRIARGIRNVSATTDVTIKTEGFQLQGGIFF